MTHPQISNETCPKGFGLKLANLGPKIPLKSQAEPSFGQGKREKERRRKQKSSFKNSPRLWRVNIVSLLSICSTITYMPTTHIRRKCLWHFSTHATFWKVEQKVDGKHLEQLEREKKMHEKAFQNYFFLHNIPFFESLLSQFAQKNLCLIKNSLKLQKSARHFQLLVVTE